MQNEVYIRKADGERELFRPDKLRLSLAKAGAKEDVIEEIVRQIKMELVDGTSTEQIYKHAFFLLRKKERPIAARYSLKRAVMDLGPSGFPFEDFLGYIFKAKGFHTKIGTVVNGFCVEHEVDVLAENDTQVLIVEAKFHNDPALKSDLKVALYVEARVEDLMRGPMAEAYKGKQFEGWLVTNTRFTDNAIKYATCKGLHLISWDYPEKGNLYDLVYDFGVHPITSLTTLSQSDKNRLLQRGMVLCDSIKDNHEALSSLGFDKDRIMQITDEAERVCRPKSSYYKEAPHRRPRVSTGR